MTGFVVKLVPDESMAAVLGDIIQRLARIEEKVMNAEEALLALAAKVADLGTVTESAVTLLNGLGDQLRAAADDPIQINNIAAQIDAQKEALAAAIVANTLPVSAPAPAPAPPPAEG